MNNVNTDILNVITEYLDIQEIKEFKFVSKKHYKSIIFNLQFIKNRIIFNKFNVIPSVISYNIAKDYLRNKDIKKCVKIIPYCKIPFSLSIFCNLSLEDSKLLIESFLNFPNLIDYEQLLDDNIISPYVKINSSNFFIIKKFIYYLVAKWTFGVNPEVFIYCIKHGSELGYSYLFNSPYFFPISSDENECYDLMAEFLRENDYLF